MSFIGLLVRCSLQIYGVTTLASSAFQNYGTWLLKISAAIGLSIGAITSLGPGFHSGDWACSGWLIPGAQSGRLYILTFEFTEIECLGNRRCPVMESVADPHMDSPGLDILRLGCAVSNFAAAKSACYCGAPQSSLAGPRIRVHDLLLDFYWNRSLDSRKRGLDGPSSFTSIAIAREFSSGDSFFHRNRLLGSLAHYIFELSRSPVSAHQGSLRAQFASYFGFPNSGSVCSLLIPVFFEEAVFRGFLQARFVRRYGQFRGVFLGSIVWAGWHFSADFSRIVSDSGVLQQLSVRMTLCVGMGLVLGWLTLRTESILPATVAHAIYDALARVHSREWGFGHSLLINLSWCFLACILFRYWAPGQQIKPQKEVLQPL